MGNTKNPKQNKNTAVSGNATNTGYNIGFGWNPYGFGYTYNFTPPNNKPPVPPNKKPVVPPNKKPAVPPNKKPVVHPKKPSVSPKDHEKTTGHDTKHKHRHHHHHHHNHHHHDPPSNSGGGGGGYIVPYATWNYNTGSSGASTTTTTTTGNLCGNPQCGKSFICNADYNRNVQPMGYPGVR